MAGMTSKVSDTKRGWKPAAAEQNLSRLVSDTLRTRAEPGAT